MVSCNGCVATSFFLPFSLSSFPASRPHLCSDDSILLVVHEDIYAAALYCALRCWIPLIHLIDYDELTAQLVPERCLFLSASFLLRSCVCLFVC
jgi:hypothetical protein